MRIQCPEKLRYHVYHILTLFYDHEDLEFHPDAPDIRVEMEEGRLCIDVFGAEHVSSYADLDSLRRALFQLLEKETGKELPWGILVGVRPSKLVVKLMEEGWSQQRILEHLRRHYLVSQEKALLTCEVAERERQLLVEASGQEGVDIYIGMPFCPTRCVYCSFASNVIQGNPYRTSYLERLEEEIHAIRHHVDGKSLSIDHVYFGGGTPTAVSDEEFRHLMGVLHDAFLKGRGVREFTVEAGRVDSLSEGKLETMRAFDVSRISINPQTMKEETLRIVGRNHSSAAVRHWFHRARVHGFDNINMDIILGLPGEVLEDVRRTMEQVLDLGPESLTVHGLAVKRASRLYEALREKHAIALGTQETLNGMYLHVDQAARSAGMRPYYMYRQKNMPGHGENVGYARPGRECLYNIDIIQEQKTILALGADGITKKVRQGHLERFANFKGLKDYVERFPEMMERKRLFLES